MQENKTSTALFLIGSLCAGIFILDLMIPTGIAIGMLYALPAFLACRMLPCREAVLVTLGCTLLIPLGAHFSPAGGTPWMYVTNRVLSVMVVWITLGLAFQRQRAQEIQATSENRLEGIVQSAMDAIISVDADQRIVLFNPAAERMFQCRAEDALGEKLDRFIPERFRTAHREHIRHFSLTNVTTRRMGQLGKISGLRADGEEFPLEASISQVEIGGKKLFSVILRDITQRVRAEELAAGQKAILEMMVTGMPLPDILSQICLMMEARSPGMTCSILLLEGTRLHLGAAPHLPEGYNQAIDGLEIGSSVGSCGTAAFRKEPVFVTDIPTDPLWADYRKLAKTYGFRACWSTPIVSSRERGMVLGTFAMYYREPRSPKEEDHRLIEMATNLAGIAIERKRGEEALKRERDFIAAVLQTAGALVVVLDTEGRIVRFNRACEQASGYRFDEIKGQRVWDFLLVPEEMEGVKAAFEDLWTKGLPNTHENFWVRKDGERRRIVWSNTVILNLRGSVEHVIATGLDVTEVKQMQEQLRRTERLAELGTLASGMAHEIGTPMNVIQGRAEYLLQRTTEEPIKKGLATIIAQVERITKIMNQLLTFARRRPIERKPMDLKKTIADCLDIVQERLKQHRVEVETSYAEPLPLVHADPDQMSQVLLNLVLNAIQAMPEGGRLSLALEPEGPGMKLSVADTGSGMPAETLNKIFDPFFTTKDVGAGTGLGLTVVHGIVEDHGGAIHVYSVPGRGTTFTIHLPIHREFSQGGEDLPA